MTGVPLYQTDNIGKKHIHMVPFPRGRSRNKGSAWKIHRKSLHTAFGTDHLSVFWYPAGSKERTPGAVLHIYRYLVQNTRLSELSISRADQVLPDSSADWFSTDTYVSHMPSQVEVLWNFWEKKLLLAYISIQKKFIKANKLIATDEKTKGRSSTRM